VEIMIVIVIIGMLAGVVTLNVRGYLNRAKQNTARQEIATICNALETFYSEFGRYPTNEEGLALLGQASEKFPEPLLQGTALDPWGRSYQYNQPGRNGPYEVICFGADGREGGSGIDEDIVSWELKQK
jgi:general secretion pathway protein G